MLSSAPSQPGQSRVGQGSIEYGIREMCNIFDFDALSASDFMGSFTPDEKHDSGGVKVKAMSPRH
jgi:hypothetical protein